MGMSVAPAERDLASSLKGGRSYDEDKAAFIERIARQRAGAREPDGEGIAEVVRGKSPNQGLERLNFLVRQYILSMK